MIKWTKMKRVREDLFCALVRFFASILGISGCIYNAYLSGSVDLRRTKNIDRFISFDTTFDGRKPNER
jgi:hypothetical protein